MQTRLSRLFFLFFKVEKLQTNLFNNITRCILGLFILLQTFTHTETCSHKTVVLFKRCQSVLYNITVSSSSSSCMYHQWTSDYYTTATRTRLSLKLTNETRLFQSGDQRQPMAGE